MTAFSIEPFLMLLWSSLLSSGSLVPERRCQPQRPAGAQASWSGVQRSCWSRHQVREQVWWVAGKRHGLQRGWYRSGALRFKIPWKNGLRQGQARHWYANGTTHRSCTYAAGKLHGVCVEWHPLRQTRLGFNRKRWRHWRRGFRLKSKKHYRKGRLYGVSRGWYATGKKHWERRYAKGRLRLLQEWHPNGRLKRSRQCPSATRECVEKNWHTTGEPKSRCCVWRDLKLCHHWFKSKSRLVILRFKRGQLVLRSDKKKVTRWIAPQCKR